MPVSSDLKALIGRAPEGLTLEQQITAAGHWVALEVYSPETLPLRRIEAIGASATDCMRQISARGLDPHRFEYTPLRSPYAQ